MKISQLYGKKIEGADKKRCGYILGISCIGDKIEGYICCNERESEFFAAWADVRFAGDGAMVLKTGKENKKASRLRLGQAVYSEEGKFLGHTEDFTAKGERLTCAHVGKKKYAFNRLILGDVIILKSDRAVAEIAAKDLFIGAICN